MKINIPQDSKMHLEVGILVWILLLLKMAEWIFVENEYEKIGLQEATAQVNFSSNPILFPNLSG